MKLKRREFKVVEPDRFRRHERAQVDQIRKLNIEEQDGDDDKADLDQMVHLSVSLIRTLPARRFAGWAGTGLSLLRVERFLAKDLAELVQLLRHAPGFLDHLGQGYYLDIAVAADGDDAALAFDDQLNGGDPQARG